MNKEYIYNNLLEQYNKLTEQEKNAILIYKSSFYYHINNITKVTNFEEKTPEQILEQIDDKQEFINKFEQYKKIIMYPQNMIVRYSVFNSINLDNILSFIESIKLIYSKIKEASLKFKLCDDLTVYRGISTNEEKVNISNSKILSTSIKIDDANDFIYQEGFNESHLFVISLKKGSNVLVTPYSLVVEFEDSLSMLKNDYTKGKLKILNRGKDGQQEIILINELFKFNEINNRKLDVGESKELNIHDIDSEILEIYNHKTK